MSDQINSCTTGPPPQEEKVLSADKTASLEGKLPNWSSMNLLSVDVGRLMEKILKVTDVNDSLRVEDMTYINNALI